MFLSFHFYTRIKSDLPTIVTEVHFFFYEFTFTSEVYNFTCFCAAVSHIVLFQLEELSLAFHIRQVYVYKLLQLSFTWENFYLFILKHNFAKFSVLSRIYFSLSMINISFYSLLAHKISAKKNLFVFMIFLVFDKLQKWLLLSKLCLDFW